MSLFPESFTEAWPFPSFNVRDLHTVDAGAASVLASRVWAPGSPGWALVVCHLLGVDHVGHTLGAFNDDMAAKLREVDALVQRAVGALDNSTLLVVLGDHGEGLGVTCATRVAQGQRTPLCRCAGVGGGVPVPTAAQG
jgi:phosphatidylinositol glycan class O